MENLQSLVDECYREFMADESIIGFNGLLKSKGLGSKRIIRIRNLIYEKYGKQNLIDIYRNRLAKLGGHSTLGRKCSTEHKQKVSDTNKRIWAIRPDLVELGRKNMIRFCVPHVNSQSESTKKKRVESRKWYKHSEETKQKIGDSHRGIPFTEEHKQKLRKTRIRRGVPHSDNTKAKLSLITKQQWKNGIHKPKFKSKGQLEVIDILKRFGYSVEDEFVINGRPFDVFVERKNLLIEFNGSFWHRDPRIEKYKNDPTAIKIWNSDKEKVDTAKKLGYDVKVIWQKDWESCDNKEEYLKQLL